ncbi:DUF885 domain-containing protein [Parasphingorhabdus halotolerans]|uniref:DUF885 domain-containing protein n=1 Tax=Parasphingorhabdus halotolerans TaxID=2725558 RepID=A0A6H2DPM7_9SPHN|nr:DUF885 domain-containing protein [Parasphingorhabdus halotolerans]QJB69915.1 DUF885 domain-containing protein [Parasphingorhabdus halotolerans]
MTLSALCLPQMQPDNAHAETAGVETEAAQFDALLATHAARIMRSAPEWATQMGVSEDVAGTGFQSHLSAYSPQANAEVAELLDQSAAELAAIDRSKLSTRRQISYDVLSYAYNIAQRQNRFGKGQPSVLLANPPYAVNQLFGPQIDIPRLLIAQQPVRSEAEARAWLSRASELSRVLDELAAMTEADARRGVIPPWFALEAIAKSATSFTEKPESEHPIMAAFGEKLEVIKDLDDAKRASLQSEALTILSSQIYPAYRRFGARMAALVPAAGRDAGLWRMKDGAAMYRVALEAYGANGLSPDEIHQIGLGDVDRIHGQMDKILKAHGYSNGSIGERMAALAKDPEYLIPDTDESKAELITKLQSDVDRILALAPQWFLDVPEYKVEVRRIPVHEQDASSGGYYTPPPLDGSRPGIFWINMKNAADIPTYTLKSLVMHEAVPGHHFQAAKSLSITDLPLIQNMMWFGDYGEGWALYAEELAKEMGMYEGDDLGNLGRLRMELYRAARLVVDTGIHDKKWSHDRAIDYMVGVTGESRDSITREIERYAVWPGQAASYKLGMIQFLRLRKKAETVLGDRFDIREFHDVALRDGSMPMKILEMRINAWIAEKRREK